MALNVITQHYKKHENWVILVALSTIFTQKLAFF